jgi:DNA-directed RNA polymerase specialized sigma24 family protein
VEARSHALLRTAYLMVGDRQLAQDLLQEALVKALVAWPRLRDPERVDAYVRVWPVTESVVHQPLADLFARSRRT